MSGIDKQKAFVWSTMVIVLAMGAAAGVARLALQRAGTEAQQQLQRIGELQRELDIDPAEFDDVGEPSLDPSADEPADEAMPWRLLPGPEIVETLQVLQELGDRAGVAFEEQKALTGADAGKQSFTVNGVGTPGAVCQFLAEVERNPRLMVVETGRIAPGGEQALSFTLGVATFHVRGQR